MTLDTASMAYKDFDEDLPVDAVLYGRLMPYIAAVAPGALVLAALLAALPRHIPAARVATHLAMFVLLRDAMTPHGMWSIVSGGANWPVPVMRLIASGPGLLALAAATAGIVWALARYESLCANVAWRKPGLPLPRALASGVAGALVIAAPVWLSTAIRWAGVLVLSHTDGADSTAGPCAVPAVRLPALLIFALVGNSYEELLFRGMLQGYLEEAEHVSRPRAAALSALAFAAGHVFLATTVTDIGWPLLAFTLYEGYVCALLRNRSGLAAAALAHGGGIFMLASGLVM
jgi:membrane protease YdiL (CAAX protease family)